MVHNPEIIQRFEQTLRRQEKQLEQSMISAVEQGREVAADSALDAADQAVQSYQKEMLFSQSTSGHEHHDGAWLSQQGDEINDVRGSTDVAFG